MKKLFCWILPLLTAFLFCGCEISNAELASSLEGNMTRLVYQVGYLDSIPSSDIENLISSNNYFVGYRSSLNGVAVTNGTTATTGGYTEYSKTFRSNLYNTQNNSGALDAVNVDLADTTSQPVATNTVEESTSTAPVSYVDIELITSSQQDLTDILLELSQKRGIIMLYCTDLRGGNLDLLLEDKKAIAEYITILKETTNYLSSSTGLLTSHYNNILEISAVENNQELINAKLIRASELLKTRYAKLDTCNDSLDAIIAILRNYVGYDYNTSQNNIVTDNVALNDSESNIENISDTKTIIDNENITDSNLPNSNTNSVTNNTTQTYLPNCNNEINNCLDCNHSNTNTNTVPNIADDQSTPSQQNNTIINNNYDGGHTQNNVSNNATETLPTNTTTDINTSTTTTEPIINNDNVNNNISPATCDTVNNIAPNNIAQDTSINNETLDAINQTEIVLQGGFVRNNTQNIDNNIYPNTAFQKTTNNNNARQVYNEEDLNPLDTTFNNPASSPSPINPQNFVSAGVVGNDNKNNVAIDNTYPQNNPRNIIDNIEGPQKLDYPEPVTEPNTNNSIDTSPENILDENTTYPENILPFNSTTPEYDSGKITNKNFAELGIVKLTDPSTYPSIPLKTLPLV